MEEKLDISESSEMAKQTLDFLVANIRGQDDAVRNLVDAIELANAGLGDRTRPLYSALLLGPSGVGKTLVAEVLAEIWFGSRSAFTKVECEKFEEPHRIADLIGSPAGYVGFWNPGDTQYRGVEPTLSQSRIDSFGIGADKELRAVQDELVKLDRELSDIEKEIEDRLTTRQRRGELLMRYEILKQQYLAKTARMIKRPKNKSYRSIILFDEIEKANTSLHNLLLNIIDKAELRLSNGMTTRFNNSVILMTSNIGNQEIARLVSGKKMGFQQGSDGERDLNNKIYTAAERAVRNRFAPEFLGRLNRISVFRPLSLEILMEIFDVELKRFQKEILGVLPIVLVVDPEVRAFIVREATDKKEEGARLLKHKIDKYIREPLGRLKNRKVLQGGETVRLRLVSSGDKETVEFYKETGSFLPPSS